MIKKILITILLIFLIPNNFPSLTVKPKWLSAFNFPAFKTPGPSKSKLINSELASSSNILNEYKSSISRIVISLFSYNFMTIRFTIRSSLPSFVYKNRSKKCTKKSKCSQYFINEMVKYIIKELKHGNIYLFTDFRVQISFNYIDNFSNHIIVFDSTVDNRMY